MPSKLRGTMPYEQSPTKSPSGNTSKTLKPALNGRRHSPHLKSVEDMHDEVIRLKKSLVTQKNDYEILKAKSRRFEEENIKKSKLIEELMDQKASDESVRLLADGGSASSSLVVSRLKHKILKLEKQCNDKDRELVLIRSDIKMTDRLEMHAAMEIYFEEVTRLKEVIATERMTSKKMKTDLDSQPSKIEALRAKILKLIAKNNALVEDNRALRKDLDQALDCAGDQDDGSVSLSEDDEYGAMNRVGLINHIRYLKADEIRKNRDIEKVHREEVERLESTVSTLGGKNDVVVKENLALKECCDLLQSDLKQEKVKVSLLEQEINQLHVELSKRKFEAPDEGSSKVVDTHERVSASETHSTTEVNSAARRNSSNGEKKIESDVVMLQSALKGHLSRADAVSGPDNSITIGNSAILPNPVEVQSILRGHISRSEHMPRHDEIKSSQQSHQSGCSTSSTSVKEEDAVYLQSAFRGHIERSIR